MPKRKSDDCDRIKDKIRRLEKKLRRKRRHAYNRYYSEESDSSGPTHTRRSPTYQEHELIGSDNEEVTINLDQPDSMETRSGEISQHGPQPDSNAGSSGASLPSVVVVPQNTGDASVDPETVSPVNQELDSELLDILGADTLIDKMYGKDLQKDLASRLEHWTTTGLTKELRKELKDKYLTPGNCKLIDAPELNAEIKAAVSGEVAKRDKAILNKQQQVTSAIACLGEAITLLLSEKKKNIKLLRVVTDAARIMSDCHHNFSTTRRNFLLGALKKEVRDQLRTTKIDKLLFGENLAETLKSAKAITRSGSDLKVTASKLQHKKPTPNMQSSSKNLNWKGQGPDRRFTGPPKTKEPATTSTRYWPTNSSKPSQYPHQRQTYNCR